MHEACQETFLVSSISSENLSVKSRPGNNQDFSSGQFSSVAQSCLTLCDTMNCSTPSLPIHHQLRSSPRLTSIELVMPSGDLLLCHPLLLLPPIPPSIRVFSNESALLMRWPEYWSFSYSISPSNEHPGLISFIIIFYFLVF